jgi:hypothetical protein
LLAQQGAAVEKSQHLPEGSSLHLLDCSDGLGQPVNPNEFDPFREQDLIQDFKAVILP